ncbi:MAG TPA: AAA family ATPase [Solirubrobacteraceae bacterium]|nr:AAA family ATPase [Solirubrobacteraceae bacterium]
MTAEPGTTTSAQSRFQAPSVKRYVRTLWEHAWLVALSVVVCLGATAVYVAAAPRKYKATSEMLISPIPAGTTTMIGLPVLFSSGDPTRDVLTASSLITTPQVAAKAISTLHLSESPAGLLGQVSATPVGQSDLVAVQATASSAARAQQIANAFPQAVIATRAAALHQAVAAIIPSLEAQVARLPRAIQNQPGTAADQLGQLQTLANSPDPTMTLAAPATLPASPYTPRVKLSLAAGLFGGLILGIGLAFAYAALDPRLRREEELRELFRIPILTQIPREPRRKLRRPMLPTELSFGALEGYRTLRAMLVARTRGGSRAFLMTGSSPAEGKTTSAIGLAAALAQGGSRVILIEADLRRPTIAQTLGLSVQYGTEHVILGQTDLADALVSTEVDGSPLRVLAVRRPGAAPADRLSHSVASRLIGEALEHADYVVIDSPPLTDVSDALPLAHVADDVLIVARIGVSRLSKLARLHDMLANQGTRPTGVVLVGDTGPRGGYYYATAVDNGEVPSMRRDKRAAGSEESVGTPSA